MSFVHHTAFVWFLSALALPLSSLAQSGDRAGEVQAPPPDHLRSPPAPPLKPDDAILTYLRKSWGHEASAVAPDEIQAIRAEVSNRGESWTESELAPMN